MRLLSGVLFLLAVGASSACWAAVKADSVFIMDTFNWAVKNDLINIAAKCEVYEEAVYGKRRHDYETDTIVYLTFGDYEPKNTHGSNQLIEYYVAFTAAKNYQLGRFQVFREFVSKGNDTELHKGYKKLKCDTFNKADYKK